MPVSHINQIDALLQQLIFIVLAFEKTMCPEAALTGAVGPFRQEALAQSLQGVLDAARMWYLQMLATVFKVCLS